MQFGHAHGMQATAERTWRYSVATRVTLACVAAFMFGCAAFVFRMPFVFHIRDAGTVWFVSLTSSIVAGLAVFMTFGFLVAVKTSIGIEGAALVATVPYAHNWFLLPRFRTIALKVGQIRSVDKRVEIITQLGLSSLRTSLSVVTDSGERVGLFNDTSGQVIQLPLDEVAGAIAASAGISVTDAGTVRTKAPGLYGAESSSWNEPRLDELSAVTAKRTAARTAQILGTLLLLTLILRACLR